MHRPDDPQCKTEFPPETGFFLKSNSCHAVRQGTEFTFQKVHCNKTHTTVEGPCKNSNCVECEKIQSFPNDRCVQNFINIKFQCLESKPKIEETGIYVRFHANPTCNSPRGTIGNYLRKAICFNTGSKILKNYFVKDDGDKNTKSTKVYFDKNTKIFYQQSFSEENCKGNITIETKHPIDICKSAPHGLLPFERLSKE